MTVLEVAAEVVVVAVAAAVEEVEPEPDQCSDLEVGEPEVAEVEEESRGSPAETEELRSQESADCVTSRVTRGTGVR